MNEQLQQIIDAVKQASPFVWHAAYRFVIVDAIMGCIFGLFFVGLAIWIHSLLKKLKIGDEMGVFFTYAGAILSACVGIGALLINIEYLLAIDYFAIKAIPGLLK